MKLAILTCLCSIALALTAFGQSPTPAVSATAVATASAGANISPAVTATPDDEDSIERSVSKKLRRHFSITTPSSSISLSRRHYDSDDAETAAWMAVPIVGVFFRLCSARRS